MESIRKVMVCTFGILKGRFRILKAGVRLHGVDVVDDIWKIWCILHNILLEVDGLTEEWSGELGNFDKEDLYILPFAIRCLHSSSELRNYDSSGMGHGYYNDANPNQTPLPPIDNSQKIALLQIHHAMWLI